MTTHPTVGTTPSSDHRRGFPTAAWTRANAVGLGITYALFALFGDGVEALLGVAHDSIVRDVAILAGVLVGAAAFVEMRRRVMAPYVERSTAAAVAAGLGLSSGFIVGFVIAGPPFDFILGTITLGTIGGVLQRRTLSDHLQRPGRLLGATITAWLMAGATAGVVGILTGDFIDTAFGSGLSGFVAVTATIGLSGGAVGGAIEGAALRRSLTPPVPTSAGDTP